MTPAPVVFDARTASPHFPGIGRYTTGLARALAAAHGPRPLALLHHRPPDARLPLPALPGIACDASPFSLAQHWEVRRRLRAARAILYHSPYYLMPLAPGVPTVVNCYDLIPLTVPGFDPARRLAFRLAHALAFRASAAIIALSTASAREIAAYFPAHAGKVRVIAPGRELPELEETPANRADPADASTPRGPYVLAVGSNKPHKNVDRLVDAWAILVARRAGGDRVRLVLAGPRDPRYGDGGAASDALSQAGRLVSLGRVDDRTLAQLYRGATLFVLPSLAEGFGFPALEAMSYGAPVVCSRLDTLVDLCGDAAAYFDARDAGQLATRLEQLLEEPEARERMRAAGRRRSAAFRWERAAGETASLYERVIGARG